MEEKFLKVTAKVIIAVMITLAIGPALIAAYFLLAINDLDSAALWLSISSAVMNVEVLIMLGLAVLVCTSAIIWSVRRTVESTNKSNDNDIHN